MIHISPCMYLYFTCVLIVKKKEKKQKKSTFVNLHTKLTLKIKNQNTAFPFVSLLFINLAHQFTFHPLCISTLLVSCVMFFQIINYVLLFSSSQNQMWSRLSEWPISQHRLCFWHGMNHLEIDLYLIFTGLMIKQIKLLLTLPITSLVWMLESITHSASLLWQQINQQKEKLSASHNSQVCRIIKSNCLAIYSSSNYM